MVYIYFLQYIEIVNKLHLQVLLIFLLGGLSSCFILLGTSLLYANSGTTSLEGFYVITSLTDIAKNSANNVLY